MISRDEYLQSLISFKEKKLIKVVTGIRRCGKSTIFELYQDYLLSNQVESKQIISINLEDGDYRDIQNPESLYDYVCDKLIPTRMNYNTILLKDIVTRKKNRWSGNARKYFGILGFEGENIPKPSKWRTGLKEM